MQIGRRTLLQVIGAAQWIHLPSSPKEPPRLTAFEIAQRAFTSLALIETMDEDGECIREGCGFFAARGVIVTNYDLVRGAGAISVRTPSDLFIMPRIVAYDVERNLAALEILDKQLRPF